MNQPPDQLIFLERAAYRRRLLTGRGTMAPAGSNRMMAKPFDNDLRRMVSEILGSPR